MITAGESPESPALERHLEQHGLASKVQFIGFQTNVRELMQDWDLVVLPSLAGEGLPITAIEALAASVPVVATRVGGLPEAIRDGENWRLVPPNNPSALAQALSDAIQNADTRQRRGEEALATFNTTFRAEVIAGKSGALYERVIRAKTR